VRIILLINENHIKFPNLNTGRFALASV
jgi:hypothetical protein